MNRKARNTLLLALGMILFLAFIGGSAINYRITKSSVHHEIVSNDLPLTMKNIYSELTAELTRPLLVSSSMAADSFLKEWVQSGEENSQRIQKYLLGLQQKYNFFSTFFISSRTLNYYHFNGIHKQISPSDEHDDWYYNFITSKKEHELDVDTDEASNNELTIFINFRVEGENGELLGVTGAGVKVDSIGNLIEQYRTLYSRSVYLSDSKGLIQVHRDSSLINKTSINSIAGLSQHGDAILSTGETPANFEYFRNGEKILLNVRYIPSLDWFLFVEQNETEALHIARMNFLRSVGIGCIASVIIVLLTLLSINRYQRQIEQMATSDELTGLANRRKLYDEFSRAAYLQTRSPDHLNLLLMDLDGFKEVNDTLGHVAGDRVLQHIASLMAKIIRPSDTLTRWGGDEFVLLASCSGEDARKMAERIRSSIEEYRWPQQENTQNDPRCNVRISCGIAPYHPSDTIDSLLRKADLALYECKEKGGNCISMNQHI